MNKKPYRKYKRTVVSPMNQRITRLSLIKYMFRVRANQRHADILAKSLEILLGTLGAMPIEHRDAVYLKMQIREMENIVKEIQKEINQDE